MTKSVQIRSNKYYLERLRKEHPTVFADYKAGKYRNPSEAFVAAGLRKKRSPLDALRSAWDKTTPAQRAAFKAEIGCTSVVGPSPPTVVQRVRIGSAAKRLPPVSGTSAIHVKGYLTPDAIERIKDVIARRRIRTGAVMREIGQKPLNPSLGMAMNQGHRINDPAILEQLATWLDENSDGK